MEKELQVGMLLVQYKAMGGFFYPEMVLMVAEVDEMLATVISDAGVGMMSKIGYSEYFRELTEEEVVEYLLEKI